MRKKMLVKTDGVLLMDNLEIRVLVVYKTQNEEKNNNTTLKTIKISNTGFTKQTREVTYPVVMSQLLFSKWPIHFSAENIQSVFC